MNRQDLINRLVARKVQLAENARALCFAGKTRALCWVGNTRQALCFARAQVKK